MSFVAQGNAHAQSSYTLYGSIDEGVGYVSNMKGGHAVVTGPIAVPDKFGLKGAEDLGGGTRAIFQLENGYFSNTGSLAAAGILFNRMAWVGLSDNRYGTVTLGRQWDLTNDVFTPNANGAVQFNNLLYHPGNVDNAAVTPVNNTVKIASPSWLGLSARVMYGFSDQASMQGRYIATALLYASGPLQLGAVYSDTRDKSYAFNTQLGFTSFLGQNLSSSTPFRASSTRIVGFGGTWTPNRTWSIHGILDTARLAGASQTARATTAELGANWNTSPFNTIVLGGFRTWLAGRTYTTAGLSDLYRLSARTLLYAEATFQHAGNGAQAAMPSLAPASGSQQASVRVGIQHFF
ncbi:porin [Burkholderia sp. MR1-5-21]